jgi:hypothetical protein
MVINTAKRLVNDISEGHVYDARNLMTKLEVYFENKTLKVERYNGILRFHRVSGTLANMIIKFFIFDFLSWFAMMAYL